MQQSNKIHFKVSLNNDIRRFSLNSLSFSTLETSVRDFFKIEDEQKLKIQYRDDENDMVTISSDVELVTASELFKEVLRFSVVLKQREGQEKDERKRHCRGFHPKFAAMCQEMKDRRKSFPECNNPDNKCPTWEERKALWAEKKEMWKKMKEQGFECPRFKGCPKTMEEKKALWAEKKEMWKKMKEQGFACKTDQGCPKTWEERKALCAQKKEMWKKMREQGLGCKTDQGCPKTWEERKALWAQKKEMWAKKKEMWKKMKEQGLGCKTDQGCPKTWEERKALWDQKKEMWAKKKEMWKNKKECDPKAWEERKASWVQKKEMRMKMKEQGFDATTPFAFILAKPGEVINHTLKLQNSGTSEWPEGTVLIRGGCRPRSQIIETSDKIALPSALKAGESCELSVPLKAPADRGCFPVVWRISLPDGTVFGRVALRLKVGQPEKVGPMKEKCRAIRTLVDMGFERNLRLKLLVEKHKNDVCAVIEELTKQ